MSLGRDLKQQDGVRQRDDEGDQVPAPGGKTV